MWAGFVTLLFRKVCCFTYNKKEVLKKTSKRARDGTRTRDPDLGKVVLHQLSHSRICLQNCLPNCISHLAKSLALVRKYTSNSLADLMVSPIIYINFPIFWLNPRPISDCQLSTLLYLHLSPIYLVVFKGSYCFHMRYPILRGASRLDAFSVYPVPT